ALLLATLGCGAAADEAAPTSPPQVAPPEAAPVAIAVPVAAFEEAPPEAPPRALPTACAAPDAAICTPPAEFVARLCKNAQPDVALSLFKKGTPFTRAWVRQPMEAWYASGARSR